MQLMQQPVCWDPGIFYLFFALLAGEKEKKKGKKQMMSSIPYNLLTSIAFYFVFYFSSYFVLSTTLQAAHNT